MKFLLSLTAAVFFCAATIESQTTGIVLSTEEDFKTQIEGTPCLKNKERLVAVKDLFLKVGATADDIKIENKDDVENLLVTKKGKTAETIIVGAHYDKTKEGCRAIDNWTGIAIVANLYKTLRPLETEKTIIFVAFGREEEGLIGSKAMAGQIKKEQVLNYCAMVNFDSFGFGYPQVVKNMSTPPLIRLAETVAKEMNIPFSEASINAGGDSQSFMNRIPAISLHGLSNNWPAYLHTAADKASNVNHQSVYIAYRHGLLFLTKIDTSPCDAFRK